MSSGLGSAIKAAGQCVIIETAQVGLGVTWTNRIPDAASPEVAVKLLEVVSRAKCGVRRAPSIVPIQRSGPGISFFTPKLRLLGELCRPTHLAMNNRLANTSYPYVNGAP